MGFLIILRGAWPRTRHVVTTLTKFLGHIDVAPITGK